MRYQPKDYARALEEVLSRSSPAEQEMALCRFASLVRRSGDGASWPKIVAEFAQVWVRRSGGRTVTVETARAITPECQASIAGSFSAKDRLTFKLDPALAAGTRITIDEEREFDFSLAGRLKKMFNRNYVL